MTGTMADSACSYATLIEHLTPLSSVQVFGLDANERLRRSFAKSGLEIVHADDVGKLGQERVVALRTSHFYDDRLVAELTAHPRDLLLVSDEGDDAPIPVGVVGTASRIASLIAAIRRGDDPRAAARATGVEIAFPTDVLPSYDAKLRKHSPPFVLPADPERTRELEDRIFDAERMPARTALGIGLAQLLALIPGTSRSAATILGGYALGCSRKAATEFSFLLSIPVLGSATLYDLYQSRDLLSGRDVPMFAVGTAVAFITALVVIRGFLKYVSGHDFRPFAWYRIGFGLVVCGWYLWR